LASTAGTNKNAIVSRLKTIISGVSGLENTTFKGYRSRETTDKTALIHLVSDELDPVTSTHVNHNLIINVLLKDRISIKEDAETTMENFVEFVGLVEDELETYSMSPDEWDVMLVQSINYTFGANQTFVFHNAMLSIGVEAQW
jgi:hypothetical protein